MIGQNGIRSGARDALVPVAAYAKLRLRQCMNLFRELAFEHSDPDHAAADDLVEQRLGFVLRRDQRVRD